jgi:hypothetical protein
MKIEEHYENLRVRANDYARRRDAKLGDAHPLSSCAREEIATLATQLAAEDWSRVRRSLAAAGFAMPAGPLKFGSTGMTAANTPYGTICRDRVLAAAGETNDYVIRAMEWLMKGAWAQAAELAQDEWECYRRAVEQGVAIAPSDPSE